MQKHAVLLRMNCFVTGASGFIGANLVHELNARGHEVKALLRKGADLKGLRGASYTAVEGVLGDRDFLRRTMRGCDWCFHVAASYHLWLPDYAPMFETNVEGTRNVIEVAAAVGCSRIIYTSTVGCIGLPQKCQPAVGREDIPAAEPSPACHYKRSKWLAEKVASDFARSGLPVVIVNPSAPAGPRDAKPTPTGRIIVEFLNRRMPAYIDTGLNWVDVRDVAAGHVLAAEKGRIGERYILGNAEGNWTIAETFKHLQDLTGIAAPRLRMPFVAALATARVNEFVSRFTGMPPRAPLSGIRMARHKMFFDPSKAIQELGLPQTPPERAFRDAVEWFRSNGYVRGN